MTMEKHWKGSEISAGDSLESYELNFMGNSGQNLEDQNIYKKANNRHQDHKVSIGYKNLFLVICLRN